MKHKMKRAQIVIIGGGHSGMTAAYNLSRFKNVNIVVLEAGRVGFGSDEMLAGTPGPLKPRHSKMVLSSFVPHYNPLVEKPTLNAFINLHGEESVASYVMGLKAGRDYLVHLAKEIDPSIVRVPGTIQVPATAAEARRIEDEMTVYDDRLGMSLDVQAVSKSTIANYLKSDAYPFDGIFFPGDAIIDSKSYVTGIKNKLLQAENVYILENVLVRRVTELAESVRIDTGWEEIEADHVIFATNGFFQDDNILRAIGGNAWSFILSLPDDGPDTPNINIIATLPRNQNQHEFSEEEGLYVTRQDGMLMVGGCDGHVINGNTRFYHREKEAVMSLRGVSTRKLPEIFDNKNGYPPVHDTHFGIYCFSLDGLPIVGRFNEGSRKLYLTACNGIGQGLLTLGALLMPSILGLEPLPAEMSRYANLMLPTRRTLRFAQQ